MSRTFEGKTIAITGAAGGVGQWLCRFFGEEGATIAALDRSDRFTNWSIRSARTASR
jgi:NAD(P)-dependent dehydrogenase (short-subunit alcohol dehydrogenase family)